MQILNEVIASLSKEELRFFKLFISRYNTDENRKDDALLEYIRKSGEDYNDEAIASKLYGNKGKTAFYRLKNRLTADLTKSLVLQYADDDDTPAYLQLLMAKHCLGKRLYQPTLFFLKKGERQAEASENYELLDIIYGEYIRLSRDIISINPDNFIQKRKDNQDKLNEVRRIDDIVAVISHKLKLSQNFSPEKEPIVKVLEKITKTYSANSPAVETSPRLMVGMFRAVSQILLQRHDYYALEQYIVDAQEKFQSLGLFEKGFKEIKLQMIVYRANALIKLQQFRDAEALAKQLHKLISESGSHTAFFNKYIFFYYNLLVNIYSETDIDRAIKLIEYMQTQTNLKKLDFYALFVPLNLAILWFGKENYRQSVRYFNELYQNDAFTKSAADLQLKVSVAELMVRYELTDFDYLQYRINQVRKSFKELLKQHPYEREKDFLSILNDLIDTPILSGNKKLLTRIDVFIKSKETADGQIISYNEWLNAKTQK